MSQSFIKKPDNGPHSALAGTGVLRTEGPAPVQHGICLPNGVMFDAFGSPRTRYVRVSYDGAHMILDPAELESFKADASAGGPDPHTYTDVYLSEREFDELPEFDGF